MTAIRVAAMGRFYVAAPTPGHASCASSQARITWRATRDRRGQHDALAFTPALALIGRPRGPRRLNRARLRVLAGDRGVVRLAMKPSIRDPGTATAASRGSATCARAPGFLQHLARHRLLHGSPRSTNPPPPDQRAPASWPGRPSSSRSPSPTATMTPVGARICARWRRPLHTPQPARAHERQRSPAGAAVAMAPVPVLQRARLREGAGLPCGPIGSRAAQVDAPGGLELQGGTVGEEHGSAIAQAEQAGEAWAAADCRAAGQRQALVFVCVGAAVLVQHQDLRLWPQRGERFGIGAEVVGAVERALDERKRACAPAHTVNDEPQPQVVLALGLRITNCAPCRLSL